MGQHNHSACRASPEPSLPRPADKETDDAQHASTAHAPEAQQTVPELAEQVADKMGHILEEAKKLVRQLKDR
jgi:hypothetical protein